MELGEDLGSGAFGLVKKATAHNGDGSSITVAVKMLKGNECHESPTTDPLADSTGRVSPIGVIKHSTVDY